MEILLNKLEAESDVAAIKIKASQFSLSSLSTQLKGQSEALEKFADIYQEFADTFSVYLTVLNTDLKHVSQSVCTFSQTDQKQGKDMEALGVTAGVVAGR